MTVPNEQRDVWTDYNDRQEFEHDLINRKTTWWLTAQALLFAAYGVTVRADAGPDAAHFRRVVAISGIALAAMTLVGVAAVVRSKLLSWRMHAAYYSADDGPRPPQPLDREGLQWGVKSGNTWVTLLPDLAQPVVLGTAWAFLL
jgi:hypothetical protein